MVISNKAGADHEERLGLQLLGRLRIKHLRLIEALDRQQSLRKAAQELNISQPAATKILQDLEDVTGVRLFERRARALKINEFGRFVAIYARRILGETERFGANLHTLVSTGHGTLSIGAIMVTAAELMPAAVLALKQSRPGTTVRLVESSSDRLLVDLAKNEYDFVIGRLVSPQDTVHFDLIPLSDEPLCVFTSRDTELPPRVRSLADLHGMQWVMQDSPTPARLLIEEAFAHERLPLPPHVVQTQSVYAMLNLVSKAGLIGVLPVTMVRNEGERFQILPIQLHGKLPPYGIIVRRGVEQSPECQEMIAILIGLARHASS
ncbi:LysR family transcriptional regulator [Caballeronia hypogeia]|uniref:LysR family transcriptional regulator n=1 Tax=Caballeronia hypogeia TaxID=1777140 RepID=A0A158AF47_9BURK|nr:LysR substrate-binding domain-containing protein [Caballeronia hypogeia]SAK56335.1 LysR family transcriptional regulator [Caballeronia hypogeia]